MCNLNLSSLIKTATLADILQTSLISYQNIYISIKKFISEQCHLSNQDFLHLLTLKSHQEIWSSFDHAHPHHDSDNVPEETAHLHPLYSRLDLDFASEELSPFLRHLLAVRIVS